MADYLYVPRVSSVYLEGAILYHYIYPDIGDTKVGYKGANNTIKVGVYNTGRWNLTWVFAATTLTSNADLSVLDPTGRELFHVDNITTYYEGGYYATRTYTPPDYGLEFNVTIFNNLQEVLDAFGNVIPPGPDSGVVVTVNAGPVDIPPSTDGVIVYAIGKALDPNSQGGTSRPGGGGGTFDFSSDPVPASPLPTISAANCGLVTLFRPTAAQLNALGNYLWTNITDFIDNLNKLFVNPMDYLISLNIFPVVPEVGTERPIRIGQVTSTISMSPILSQWYNYDCGTVRIDEHWGSYLDYAPYTKVSLFLPFIGSVSLNTDEVMNHTIGVQYRFDLISGQCVALVKVDGDVYYQFTGECAVAVPLTGSDWSRIYSAAIGAIGAAAVGAAAGVTSGALLNSAARSAMRGSSGSVTGGYPDTNSRYTRDGKLSLSKKELVDLTIPKAMEAAADSGRSSYAFPASRIVNTINNTVGQVTSGKLIIQHSGSVSGSAGFLGNRVPHILIEYPDQSLADNYMHFVGYPSNMRETLSMLHGYTEVEQVLLSIPGTDEELGELLEVLKGGVYLP